MSTGPITAAFSALPDGQALASRWQALEARADGGFFLGWTWMGSWLAATGARPALLALTRDGRDIALALVGRGMRGRLFGRVPALCLNEAGRAGADRAFIEYNGLLIAGDAPEGAMEAGMAAIAGRRDWRLLRLSGLPEGSALPDALPARRRICVDRAPAYFVDLAAVRAEEGDYLALLSGNSRSQIRRSMRDYGDGRAEIARAAAMDEADGWLEEMRALNDGRHADNAWEEPMFRAFARELVRRGMGNGEVELLRIAQDGHLLGYLLNFVHRKRAMNYQSAFAQPLTARSKPGLMCHAAAVGRYAAAGHGVYSLLAGKDRYKQSLSTGAEMLVWWELERFSLRLEAEHMLRRFLKRPVSA